MFVNTAPNNYLYASTAIILLTNFTISTVGVYMVNFKCVFLVTNTTTSWISELDIGISTNITSMDSGWGLTKSTQILNQTTTNAPFTVSDQRVLNVTTVPFNVYCISATSNISQSIRAPALYGTYTRIA